MQENEIKYYLCKQEYLKLKSVFDDMGGKSKTQVNYYYDTQNMDLFKSGRTLRVRQIEEELKLQLKYPMGSKEHIIQKIEKEIIIDKLTKEINLVQIEHKLGVHDLGQYKIAEYLGELITDRISVDYNEWLKFELDANYYLGETDYELEIEIQTGKEEEALPIVNRVFGDEFQYTKFGKVKRFNNRYKSFFQED